MFAVPRRSLLFSLLLSTVFAEGGFFDVKDWPDSCTKYPGVQGVVQDPQSGQDEPRRCQLTYPYNDNSAADQAAKEQAANDFCQSVHHDRLQKSTIDAANQKVTCHYDRDYVCDKEQVLINGFCYFVPTTDKMSYEDALQKCRSLEADLPTNFELPNLKKIRDYWLVALDQTVRAVWLEGLSLTPAQVQKGLAQVFRLRYDLDGMGNPLSVEEVSKMDGALPRKQHVMCYKEARFLPTAMKKYCEQLKALKIPANYHKGICFMLSTSWSHLETKGTKADNIADLKKDYVEGFHKECSWMGKSAQAAGPWSHAMAEGMEQLMKAAQNPQQMVILPGTTTKQAAPFDKAADKYAYFAKAHTRAVNLDLSFRSGFAKEEFKDLTRAVLMYNDYEKDNTNERYRVTVVPSWVRAPLICALNVPEEDLKHNKCDIEDEWSYRDDGTVMCHKVMNGAEQARTVWEQKCQEAGAKPGSIDNALELKKILKLWENRANADKLFLGSKCSGSKTSCKLSEMEWEDGSGPVWYSRIKDKDSYKALVETGGECLVLTGEGFIEAAPCSTKLKGIVCSKTPTV